jgi:hypothetical protein
VRSGESGPKPRYSGLQAKGTPEALIAEVKDLLRNAEAIIGNKLITMAWKEGGDALESSSVRRLGGKDL